MGAVVIVVGLYLVLWGKSKDQPGDSDNVVPTAQNMATMSERIIASNQELVAIDMM